MAIEIQIYCVRNEAKYIFNKKLLIKIILKNNETVVFL